MSAHRQPPYPRPDFERPDLSWLSLNGPWDFLFDDEDVGLAQRWHQSDLPAETGVHKQCQIEVPYVFQTPASGVDNRDAHEVLWYQRKIPDVREQAEIDQGFRLLIRCGAVDYEATIWVNNHYVGGHRGGHVPFDIDITDAIDPGSQENRLIMRVRDSPSDLSQPRGKQYWKPQPESIFYTPSSGIWQTVWLESVPATRIADSSHGTIIRSNYIASGQLHAEIAVLGSRAQESLAVEVSAKMGDIEVGQTRQGLPLDKSSVDVVVPMWIDDSQIEHLPEGCPSLSTPAAWRSVDGQHLALWSPEHPLLYDLIIRLRNSDDQVVDEVHTYTGMRTLSWMHADNTFHLNGEPYFQALVLDQGYWPRTNMTPPKPDALRQDIKLSKAMGFNGCRKHQKVEDPLMLYWADRLGYLVWGEMANAYQFSSTYVDRFDAEWKEAVKRDINHPCIVTWTPTNESWGYDNLAGNKKQRDHLRSLYHMTKTLDPTRPVNDNCGWEHVSTDLTTFHEYADGPALKDICATMDGILDHKGGRPMFVRPLSDDAGSGRSPFAPVICTEFGGVNIAPGEGDEVGDRDWGYTTASDPEDLLRRVEALIMAVVEGGYCCGFVYTQLTDIEQEVNGLYSFDRRAKLDPKKVRDVMEKAKARYFELLAQKSGTLSS